MNNQEKGRDSIQDSDIRLLLYRLETLTDTTKSGFAEIKDTFKDHEKRLRYLETWRSDTEADKRAQSRRFANPAGGQSGKNDSTDNLIKIIFIILGLLGTALGLIGTGIVGT